MAHIKPSKPFIEEFANVLAYALEEFGTTTVKHFETEYKKVRKRLIMFPLSSPREPILKKFLRPYRSAHIMKNWKIIYRYDEENDRVIFVDLWDMRRHPRTLIRQFKRKL